MEPAPNKYAAAMRKLPAAQDPTREAAIVKDVGAVLEQTTAEIARLSISVLADPTSVAKPAAAGRARQPAGRGAGPADFVSPVSAERPADHKYALNVVPSTYVLKNMYCLNAD